MTEDFYVYIYENPMKNNQPFYVGKGRGSRYRKHITEARNPNTLDTNLHKLRTIRKILDTGIEPTVRIVDSGLSEDTAFELEKMLISEIGRADLGKGSLTNMTDGGDGDSGRAGMKGELNPRYGKPGTFLGRKHSEETKKKLSEINTGKTLSEETKKKLSEYSSGRPAPHISLGKLNSDYVATETHRENLSKAAIGNTNAKGRKMSVEEIEMRSKALLGHKKPRTECSVCGKSVANHMLHRYHEENCKEKLL